ncbi:MAG TPA: hypothetical protein VL383_10730 [Gemmatimonadaceae bacterium]|jgi:hypothetical protein|nr:hypothetical protein [Gemmatimonadaceae bacterium]
MVWQVVVVWVVAVILGGILWQRFTRPPGMPTMSVPGQTAVRPRRVVPLWLALVLLIILAVAVWLTLRLGAAPAS